MAISEPIIILGGGNMGGSLAMRWRSTVASTSGVHLIEPDEKTRERYNGTGIVTYKSLDELSLSRGILVLAIKPSVFPEMVPVIKQSLARGNSLLVSVMAGVPLADLEKITPRCARMMPNTPTKIGEGITVACNPKLEPAVRNAINKLFEYTGRILWIEDEAMMHAATAVSGSGPAYVFAFMEAFERAARGLGFSAATARALVNHTIAGSAQLAIQSQEDPLMLRRSVTSPKGTTESALNVLLHNATFPTLIEAAVKAAHQRSIEIGDEL